MKERDCKKSRCSFCGSSFHGRLAEEGVLGVSYTVEILFSQSKRASARLVADFQKGYSRSRRCGYTMRFVEGCDFQEFSRYLAKIGQYTVEGELDRLRNSLESGRLNLIVFRENGEIIGHAIWHETNTEEHRKGDPREREDMEILQGFMGKGKDFIELHELWLTDEHRGRGYGKQFFDFFEDCMRRKGYDSLVYYAYDPAAIAICRKRGYKEAYGLKEAGPYGNIETMYVFYLRLKKNRRVHDRRALSR